MAEEEKGQLALPSLKGDGAAKAEVWQATQVIVGPSYAAQPLALEHLAPVAQSGSRELARLEGPPRMVQRPRTTIEWGARRLSVGQGHEGFYRISGATNSGKTHLIKLFTMDVLREMQSNPNAKLIVYEPKREFYPWILTLKERFGFTFPVHYFMLSDRRSVALDFATDYEDDIDADTLAYAFYPDRTNHGESQFWGDSLRTIFASLFTAIKAKLGRADLRLVCLVLEDEELTRKLLSYDPYLVQAQFLASKGVGETPHNIRSTIQSRVRTLKHLANDLDRAAQGRPLFSLRRFIQEPGSGVLVISKSKKYALAQEPMNGVLLLRLTQLLDDEQEDPSRKIYVVIDEFPTLCGKDRCPGIGDMFYTLRSRGAVPLVADQGLTMVKPIYGEETTAILGQCSNVVYLRQPDLESAEYAAKDLGVEQGYEKKPQVSYGGNVATTTIVNHPIDRPIVHPSKLRNLSEAKPETGIHGYGKSGHNAEEKPWPFSVPPETVDQIPKRDRRFGEYERRSPEQGRLRQFEEEESTALGAEDVEWTRHVD